MFFKIKKSDIDPIIRLVDPLYIIFYESIIYFKMHFNDNLHPHMHFTVKKATQKCVKWGKSNYIRSRRTQNVKIH